MLHDDTIDYHYKWNTNNNIRKLESMTSILIDMINFIRQYRREYMITHDSRLILYWDKMPKSERCIFCITKPKIL